MRSLIAVLLLLSVAGHSSEAADSVSAERRPVLQKLLYQDCGSCHGMRLTGGLGPALTPDAMTGKSRDYLFQTIRDGRPGTPMPPWKELLSTADINWLVNFLQHPDNQQ